MAITKRQKQQHWQGRGEKETLYTTGRNVNWHSLENGMEVPQKMKSRTTI